MSKESKLHSICSKLISNNSNDVAPPPNELNVDTVPKPQVTIQHASKDIIPQTSETKSTTIDDCYKLTNKTPVSLPLNSLLISDMTTGQMKNPIDLLFITFAIVNNPKDNKQQIYKLLFTDGVEFIQLVQWGYSKIVKTYKPGTCLLLSSFRIDKSEPNDTDKYICSFNTNNFTLISNAASTFEKSTKQIVPPYLLNSDLTSIHYTCNTLISIHAIVSQVKHQTLKTTRLTSCLLIDEQTKSSAIEASLYNLKSNILADKIYNIQYVIYSPFPEPKFISSPFTKLEVVKDAPSIDLTQIVNQSLSSVATETAQNFSDIENNQNATTSSITGNFYS
jgi:hypothetical protein